MTDLNDTDPKLEQLVHHMLRELPPRQAPESLEGRVLKELARLAALPWWRRSFAHWPGVVRLAFLSLCLGLSALTFIVGGRLVASLAPARKWSDSLDWLRTVVEAAGSLAHAIPSMWLYEGLAVAALLYGFMFALGAAAYRTLYLDA
jgi:hypothetical protein